MTGNVKHGQVKKAKKACRRMEQNENALRCLPNSKEEFKTGKQ